MLEVAEHYYHFGGRSPINDQNRALIDGAAAALSLPVYWGNRNWHPMLADTCGRWRDGSSARGVRDFGLQFVFGLPAVSKTLRKPAKR